MTSKNEKTINMIIESNKITDYLATKNVFPVQDGERYKYSCPLHQEKTPSFVVYTNDGIQSFYCFGCKVGGSIINLISNLEKISVSETIKKLGGDIDISDEAELSLICEKLKSALNKEIDEKQEFKDKSSCISLNFSLLGSIHLKMTDYDEETFNMLEDLYKHFDENIWLFDIKSVDNMYKYIVSEKLFQKRMSLWKNKQKENKRKLYARKQDV